MLEVKLDLPFKIGDTAYYIKFESGVCDFCGGEKTVAVSGKNKKEVVIECPYCCGEGTTDEKGYVVKSGKIIKMWLDECRLDVGNRIRIYLYYAFDTGDELFETNDPYNKIGFECVYATREEAQKIADKLNDLRKTDNL